VQNQIALQVYKSQVDDALITQDKITQEEYKIKLDAQKQKQCEISKPERKYQVQLDSLQVELEQANRDNNVEKAVEVLEQKKTKKSIE
jgi:hypothetical protein